MTALNICHRCPDKHFLYKQNVMKTYKSSITSGGVMELFKYLTIKIFEDSFNRFFFYQDSVNGLINMLQVVSIRIGNNFTVLQIWMILS